MPSGFNETKGAYFVINLNADRSNNQAFNFIVHKGDERIVPTI